MGTADEGLATHRNVVSLVGRISSAPVERDLPSGDRLLTFRIAVARERTPMTEKSKQVSDCSAWAKRVRYRVSSRTVGDQVALEGALRRRFFRTSAGRASRVEIEVLRGRRLGGAR